VILIVLAIIIGLIKNYYIIIGSVISVTLFLILKKYKYTLVLIIIFGISILTSTLVSEITKIQLLPFAPVEEKEEIYPIYRDNPDGEYSLNAKITAIGSNLTQSEISDKFKGIIIS